ncbi:MAG: hypothetical protein JRE23_14995 [Deltaproteobacteria bacterium]|nr:hypothetical protein [Deltaproteobacteria bacterium]
MPDRPTPRKLKPDEGEEDQTRHAGSWPEHPPIIPCCGRCGECVKPPKETDVK